MKIPLAPPLIKGEDKKDRIKFPPFEKGWPGGIFTVKGKKPYPVSFPRPSFAVASLWRMEGFNCIDKFSLIK
jgi:hypothetical protein